MTAQYGLHEAKAHNLLKPVSRSTPWQGEYIQEPPSAESVSLATAHFLGQLAEELQQHRTDSQTATEELVHVLDDGLNSVADAINRLVDVMERPSRRRWLRRVRQVPIDTGQPSTADAHDGDSCVDVERECQSYRDDNHLVQQLLRQHGFEVTDPHRPLIESVGPALDGLQAEIACLTRDLNAARAELAREPKPGGVR